MKEEILKKYSIDELMNTNGSQLSDFLEILQKKMRFYNSNNMTTTKGEIIDNLNSAKDAAIENIQTLLERNTKMDIMVHKSNDLIDISNNMSIFTRDISRKESERKNKYVVFIISLFIIILILIYAFAF